MNAVENNKTLGLTFGEAFKIAHIQGACAIYDLNQKAGIKCVSVDIEIEGIMFVTTFSEKDGYSTVEK